MASMSRSPAQARGATDEEMAAIRSDIYWLHKTKRYSYKKVAEALFYSRETIRQWMLDNKRPHDPEAVLAKLKLLKNSP